MESKYIRLIQLTNELAYIAEKKLDVIQLRPRFIQEPEDFFNGDTDFIINRDDYKEFVELVYEFAKNNGINFKIDQRNYNKVLFYFFIDKEKKIVFELWFNISISYSNKKNYTSESIIELINEKKVTKEEIKALLFITHLYHRNKKTDSGESKFRISKLLEELEQNVLKDKVKNVLKIYKDINQENLKDKNELSIKTLNKLGLKYGSRFEQTRFNFYQKLRRNIFNYKKIIPIVGPDGSGKGTVSENALKGLKEWKIIPFRLLYRFKYFYRLRTGIYPNNKNMTRGQIDEKIPYYIFFTSLFMLTIVPTFYKYFRNKKYVLLDRYFIDFYATPIRYLEGHPKPKKIRFYNFILFLTPIPNKFIFLGCKNETLQERKNELPDVSVEYLQTLNVEFIIKKKIPEVLFLSTENTIDTSVNNMRTYLIQKL